MPSVHLPSSPTGLSERPAVGVPRPARTNFRQLLHRLRGRQAVSRRRGRPASILVLCHGNLPRRPYIEGACGVGSVGTKTGARVRSAGFIGPGRPVPADGVDRAPHRGVDLTGPRSRLASVTDAKEPTLSSSTIQPEAAPCESSLAGTPIYDRIDHWLLELIRALGGPDAPELQGLGAVGARIPMSSNS